MTKSQFHSTWLEQIYQLRNFQSTIFIGFNTLELNPMTIVIDNFVNSINLEYLEKYFYSNKTTGGRPPYDCKISLKTI